jgi:hypothetical protein
METLEWKKRATDFKHDCSTIDMNTVASLVHEKEKISIRIRNAEQRSALSEAECVRLVGQLQTVQAQKLEGDRAVQARQSELTNMR